MPADMPKCGYDGSLCDYTTLYITLGVILFLAGLFTIEFAGSFHYFGFSPHFSQLQFPLAICSTSKSL
jgi:hypothetical protein